MRLILNPEGANEALRSANWGLVPLWLWALLIVFFCASGRCFFLWVPYEGAVTPQEAIQQSPELAPKINPNWKALTINHGEVSEWPNGTIAQNPEGYRVAHWWFILSTTITTILGFIVLAIASGKKPGNPSL